MGLLDLLDVHHGSHVHAPAYAVLLALTGYAALFLGVTRKSLAANGAEAWHLAIIFFALFPGHLANLQWGWQVAVFISLGGVAVMILALTRRQLSWHLNIAALAAAALVAVRAGRTPPRAAAVPWRSAAVRPARSGRGCPPPRTG